MTQNSILLLHTALVDWWTVSSFEDEFFQYWKDKIESGGEEKSETRVLQYEGITSPHSEGGSIFIGVAEQKGRYHYLLRISGYAAECLKPQVFAQLRQGFARFTRVDLQITVNIPEKWSQWELLCRLKDGGKMTGWVESSSGDHRFETVYVGSRKSDRFTRIYVKRHGSTRLLRLETEYKGKRAHAVARALADGELSDSFLLHELQHTLRDKPLSILYERSLLGDKPMTVKLRISTGTEKTERWLLEQVYPAFSRHINDHNSSGKVAAAFWMAIQESFGREVE